uniref:Spire-type actin nucleation factor 1b n=1 Tax=Hucho hucho TaxID=62062 RepID=A0A4W5JJI5_9TELE
MRLPSKPYANLPIYSLGSTTTLPRDRVAALGKAASIAGPAAAAVSHGSLEMSQSRDELELPAELTEDWSTMEVCVDCKKFIHDIISSSKHSLSLATKRARLKRKTQSFYMSSPKGPDYRPSERTINEI